MLPGTVSKAGENTNQVTPPQANSTNAWGRSWSWLQKSKLIDFGAYVAAPSLKTVSETFSKLKTMASNDERIIHLMDEALNYLIHNAGLSQDESNLKNYLKNFLGNLFLVLGDEVLIEKKRESFSDGADLFRAVLIKIATKITDDVQSLKDKNETEIEAYASSVVDYFFQKVMQSEKSYSIRLVLNMLVPFFKKNFTLPLAGYYQAYADIARGADRIRNASCWDALEPSVIYLKDYIRYQLEKYFFDLSGEFDRALAAGTLETGQPLLPIIIGNSMSEFYKQNRSIIDEVETYLIGRLIDLNEETVSIQATTSKAVEEIIARLKKAIDTTGDSLEDDHLMKTAASEFLDWLINYKFDNNPLLQMSLNGPGQVFAANYLRMLSYDAHFYQESLNEEFKEADQYLKSLPCGKGTLLINMLRQMARLAALPPEGSSLFYSAMAPIMRIGSGSGNEDLVCDLLSNAFVILAARTFKGTRGENLDQKVESLFHAVSDNVDTIFARYQHFQNSTVDEKITEVEKLIQNSFLVKYDAMILQEEGLDGLELFHQVYLNYTQMELFGRLLNLLLPEDDLIDLLPTFAKDFPIYDSLIRSLQAHFSIKFDSLFSTCQILKDKSRLPDKHKFESLFSDGTVQLISGNGEIPKNNQTSLANQFQQIFMRGGLKFVSNKIQSASSAHSVLGDSGLGIIRSVSKNLTDSLVRIWDGRSFFAKTTTYATGLLADYFENGVGGVDINRFQDKKAFVNDFIKQLLSKIFPGGAEELPVDDSLKDGVWREVNRALKGLFNTVITKLDDKIERKKLLLTILTGKTADCPHSETELNQSLEQAMVGQAFETVVSKITDLIRSKLLIFLLTPFIWIFSWILSNLTAHSARKFLEKIDHENFPIFMRKLLWDFSAYVFKGNDSIPELELKSALQNNLSKLAESLDIFLPVRTFAVPHIASDLLRLLACDKPKFELRMALPKIFGPRFGLAGRTE